MQTEDGAYHAFHQDEQGSTVYITEQGVENCYQYDAFGNLTEKRESFENRILYTGQQYDQETGQYYLRARYYNPVVGRFLQEDTYRGDGLNLYAYCANNPVVYYDPSGQNFISKLKDLCNNLGVTFPEDTPAEKISDALNSDDFIDSLQPTNNHNIVAGETKLPANDQPNSSADLLNPDGSVKQRRYYDDEGKPILDVDFNHTDDGTHKFPHVHIWDWSKKVPRSKENNRR